MDKMSAYNEMYMRIAMSIRPMSGCFSGQVGSVLVLSEHPGVIIPAYNVPPPGRRSCREMGCCELQNDGKKDRCVNTVHSEMVGLQIACNAGYKTSGGILYCTKLPCHSCAKVLAQFKISQVYYLLSNNSLGSIGFDVVPSIRFKKVEEPKDA